MYLDEFREYCLSKRGVTEELPFGPDTLVFKVMGKMFALTGLENEKFSANLKCDPDRSIELREECHEVIAGFHMSKKHWNTVDFEGDLPESLLRELIDHSYELVVAGLTKKLRAELDAYE